MLCNLSRPHQIKLKKLNLEEIANIIHVGFCNISGMAEITLSLLALFGKDVIFEGVFHPYFPTSGNLKPFFGA